MLWLVNGNGWKRSAIIQKETPTILIYIHQKAKWKEAQTCVGGNEPRMLIGAVETRIDQAQVQLWSWAPHIDRAPKNLIPSQISALLHTS